MTKCTVKMLMKTVALLKKSGTSDTLKSMLDKSGGEISEANAFGMLVDIMTGVCGESVQQDTLELLGIIFDKTADEVADMEVSALWDGLKQFGAENNLTDFFTQAFTSATRA